MILSYVSLLLFSFCILGYSFFFKNIILKKKEKIFDLDFIYGVLILIIFSILINFFLPLKYFVISTFGLGLIFFILIIYSKRHNISFLRFSVISFLIIFISHGQGITYDSQLYHLQTIQHASNNKIIFGIANLQPHYAMNSTWHALLSLINLKFHGINLIYLANLSILSFCINQIFSKINSQKNKISFIFLTLSILYIFTYSYFHPYNNGTILNLLGSPDADFPGMIFYILSIYFFILCVEKKKIEDFYLLIVAIFLTVTIKISYLGVLFFYIYALCFFKKKKFLFNNLNLFILIAGLLWVIKSFILSGCIVFPVYFTCFDTIWALDKSEVESYSKIVQSFARDTPERLNFINFEYTLNSSKWFVPWFKQYFLKTEFLFVSFILIFSSLLISIIFYDKINTFKTSKKIFFLCIIIFVVNLFIWFRAPEIRFGYGTIISFVCFLLSFNFNMIRFNHLNKNFFLILFIIIFIPILSKNFENYKYLDEISFERNFDYSKIKKIYDSNNIEVFKPSNSVFCNDFQKFCTYQGFNVNIKHLKGYYFLNR